MSSKITVKTTPKNIITINTHGGAGAGLDRLLVQLKDVDATNLVDNGTLVYDQTSGKFIVEILPEVDGGEF